MIIIYETQYTQPIRNPECAALYLAQKIPSLDRARSLKVITANSAHPDVEPAGLTLPIHGDLSSDGISHVLIR